MMLRSLPIVATPYLEVAMASQQCDTLATTCRWHAYSSFHTCECMCVCIISHIWMYVRIQVKQWRQKLDVTHESCHPYACISVWFVSRRWMYVCMQGTRWGHKLNIPHMNHVTVMNIWIYTSYVAHVNARVYAGHTMGTATDVTHMNHVTHMTVYLYGCVYVCKLHDWDKNAMSYVWIMSHVWIMSNTWTYEHMNI